MKLDRLTFALRVLRSGAPPAENYPALIPDENPLRSPDGAAVRQRAALRMMDEDCYGFLLLTVHRAPVGARVDIEIAEYLHRTWLPAIADTLDRIAVELENVP